MYLCGMDAKLFSRMIRELLSRGEQVVLSEFGTFYTELVPAFFSDKGYTINPPYLKVCFVLDQRKDDHLAEFYASSNDIPLAQARRLVGDYVVSVRNEVFDTKSFVLPELGRLRAISRDNVFFIQEEGLELFPGYDSLEPISLKSHREEPSPSPDPSPATDVVETTEAVQSMDIPQVDEAKDSVKDEAKDAVKEGHSKRTVVFRVVFLVLFFLALIIGAIAFLGRYCPEMLDPFLYSEEELEIVRYYF